MTSQQSAFRPLRAPRHLARELIERLTDEIIAGRLEPNARLPTEQEMIAAFGVSRTVVREALAVLRAEGLVDIRQGSGAYVARDLSNRPFRIDPEGLHSIAEVVQVLELRIAVETEAAGLAASRRKKPDLDRIAAARQAFEAAYSKGESAVDEDYDFHSAIGMATGNPYFSSFLEFIGRLIIPRRTIHLVADPDRRRNYLARVMAEHDAILGAIESGDVGDAQGAMRAHLERSLARYRRLAKQVA
jgi:GntR family transcriptional regulator, transcriptional repressor for pyruvate dehydrogenase complex